MELDILSEKRFYDVYSVLIPLRTVGGGGMRMLSIFHSLSGKILVLHDLTTRYLVSGVHTSVRKPLIRPPSK
jgi:hypothetical protein